MNHMSFKSILTKTRKSVSIINDKSRIGKSKTVTNAWLMHKSDLRFPTDTKKPVKKCSAVPGLGLIEQCRIANHGSGGPDGKTSTEPPRYSRCEGFIDP